MHLKHLILATTTILLIASNDNALAQKGQQGQAREHFLQQESGKAYQGGRKALKKQKQAQGKRNSSGRCCQQVTSLSDLSDKEISSLKFMYEEEKLAGDLYEYFSNKWNSQIPFQQIASSEDRHKAAIEKQLSLHNVDISDLTGNAKSTYSNQTLQALYDESVDRGNTSSIEALKIGAEIEEHDIKDLNAAIAETNAPEFKCIYSKLMEASKKHLIAFVRQLSMNGVNYTISALSDEDLNSIQQRKGKRECKRMNNIAPAAV